MVQECPPYTIHKRKNVDAARHLKIFSRSGDHGTFAQRVIKRQLGSWVFRELEIETLQVDKNMNRNPWRMIHASEVMKAITS